MANLYNLDNKFLVTTTGEVLIGQTSNNGNRLQITGADGASYIYLKTDVATTGGRIGFNGDALRVFNQQASGELQLGTAGVSRVRISNSLVVFPTITELRGDIAAKFIAIGDYEDVKHTVPGPLSLDESSQSQMFFLAKYIGNYEINKIGNKFLIRNGDKAVVIEKDRW